MDQASVWGWAAGVAGLCAALVGLYYASKLNKLTRGGVIGSSVGLVIFGFVILAITALFDQLIVYVRPLLPYSVEELGVARELLRLLAMTFFAAYFYKIYRGFSGYAARERKQAAPSPGAGTTAGASAGR